MLTESTIEIQNAVAEYCITGKTPNLPNTSIDRLSNYKRLVQNVIKDSIEAAFPITLNNIESAIWDEMLELFLQKHKCQSPAIWQMPYEFYQFAIEQNFTNQYQIPLLNELLYFEWTEIEMFMMEDKIIPKANQSGNIYSDSIIINPEYQIIQLEYPLHQYIPSEAIHLKGQYFVLIFRELDSKRLQFVQVSPLHVWLIEYLNQEQTSLQIAIQTLSKENNLPISTEQEKQLVQFFEHLNNKEFIAGFNN